MDILKIFLTSILAMIISLPMAFMHWLFGLVWLGSLFTFIYTAIKLIWEVL